MDEENKVEEGTPETPAAPEVPAEAAPETPAETPATPEEAPQG